MPENTTFVPHETKSTSKAAGNFLLFFSIAIFVGALVFAGGAYFLRVRADAQIASYQASLDRANERFSEGVPIRSIEEFDIRLRAARDILAKHKSFTGLLGLIERITLKNIQFTSFSYTEIENNKKNVVRLVGRAPSYKAIAEQSEQFSLDEEARRYVTDVVFSNLSIDTKDTGLITFEVMFTVDPEFLAYSRYLQPMVPITQSPASPRDAAPIRNQ